MNAKSKKYFKYLDLVREDIREEFELLGFPQKVSKLCDYGCGDGLTTFSLALETHGAECIGVDLFNQESKPTPEVLNQYITDIENQCQDTQGMVDIYPGDLGRLVGEKRLPRFIQGNITLGQNLPLEVDLAYCKKILINLLVNEYKGMPSGEDGLRLGLKHITQSLTPGGLLYAIEYDIDFGLSKYLELSQLNIIKNTQIIRREIRSWGRTPVVSTFSLYLCQRG